MSCVSAFHASTARSHSNQGIRARPPKRAILALLAGAGVTGDDADSIFAMPRAFLQRRSSRPFYAIAQYAVEMTRHGAAER
jgi:hypothetical protein